MFPGVFLKNNFPTLFLRASLGIVFLIAVPAFFIHDKRLATERSKQLRSLRLNDIRSIVISRHQNTGTDFGSEISDSEPIAITNAEEISLFLSITKTTHAARWIHFVTIEQYNIIVNPNDNQYKYKAFRMNSAKYGDNIMWMAFTDNNGAYVPDLYRWISMVESQQRLQIWTGWKKSGLRN
jgi:hypothetical protein